MSIIQNYFPLQKVSPQDYDKLMGLGIRHLGEEFFQYSHLFHEGRWKENNAYRIDLRSFEFSKSQRKVLRENTDLRLEIGNYEPNEEKSALFDQHFAQFNEPFPVPITRYIHPESAILPVQSVERCLYLNDRLIALSIAHHGEKCHSGTYCFYDVQEKKRSLGTYTLLIEIQAALQAGMDYFYLGFASSSPARGLYKLNFNGLERLEWMSGEWIAAARLKPPINA